MTETAINYTTISKKVLFAIPYMDNLCIGLTQVLGDLKKYEDYEVETYLSKQMPVDANRNHMVRHFMENTNAEYLLFNDDDIVPPRDILSMISHKKPIVSALCMIMKKGIPLPLIMEAEGEGFKMMNKDKVDSELLKVDGIGCGSVLIHREVFETIAPPWFLFDRNEYGEVSLGEDYYFSNKAREHGFQLYVDISKLCGHIKEIDLAQLRLDMDSQLSRREEQTIDYHAIEDTIPEFSNLNFSDKNDDLLPIWKYYVTNVSDDLYAISFELANQLMNLCKGINPKRILDLGSGFSSYVFRKYREDYDPSVDIISIDTDSDWLEKTKTFLNKYNFLDGSVLLHQELSNFKDKPFDLISVDGSDLEFRAKNLERYYEILSDNNGVMVFDDMHYGQYKNVVDKFIQAKGMKSYSLRKHTLDRFNRYSIMAIRTKGDTAMDQRSRSLGGSIEE